MLFPKRQDFIAPVTGIALGTTRTQELTREFMIESILIKLSFTQTAVMATANPDKLQNVLKRVTLNVADGARTRTPVDMSGPALLELARQWMGQMDRSTAAAVNTNTNAAYVLYYPIFFSHPQLLDPIGSSLLLPVTRFNSNPVLTMYFATQADMDTNGTPTFAIAAGITVEVIVNRRQVNIKDWPTFDTELTEYSVNYASTGNAQRYELQTPGSYSGILMRGYTSTTARGDISSANGEWKVDLLGTNIRRFKLPQLEAENDMSTGVNTGSQLFTGSYYLDFLSDKTGEGVNDLGSVLDTNVLVASGARAGITGDITGGAGVQMKYCTHRIFGDLSALKLGK